MNFYELEETELIVKRALADYIVHMHIVNLANAIDQYRHVWELGDGFGGYVKSVLAAQLRSRGFAWEPSDLNPEPAYMTGALRQKIIAATRREVFESQPHICVNCGSEEDLEIDHIHPVSRGGRNTLDNLQLLCRTCNRSKHAMTMDEWESSGRAAECRGEA